MKVNKNYDFNSNFSQYLFFALLGAYLSIVLVKDIKTKWQSKWQSIKKIDNVLERIDEGLRRMDKGFKLIA
jgi:hypothetical protein